MVWSFSRVAIVVQLPSVALFVEHIFSTTSDVDGPPIVEVVEVDTEQLIDESLVDEICVPVAPVPTSERLSVEVVRATLGMAGKATHVRSPRMYWEVVPALIVACFASKAAFSVVVIISPRVCDPREKMRFM